MVKKKRKKGQMPNSLVLDVMGISKWQTDRFLMFILKSEHVNDKFISPYRPFLIFWLRKKKRKCPKICIKWQISDKLLCCSLAQRVFIFFLPLKVSNVIVAAVHHVNILLFKILFEILFKILSEQCSTFLIHSVWKRFEMCFHMTLRWRVLCLVAMVFRLWL